MEVYALVGPPGTGKSHRAGIVASEIGADAIIDDGLLISKSNIVAGASAKREPTFLEAFKAALFMDEGRAIEMRAALRQLAPEKLLVLGTSVRMIHRIAQRLELPETKRIMYIEDFATEKEIRKASYLRNQYNKHVIPAPTFEVKKSLPGTMVNPFQIFIKKKENLGGKEWLEHSVVRPTYTLHGRLIITDQAIAMIVACVAHSVSGVTGLDKVTVNVVDSDGSIIIDASPTIVYGMPVHQVAGDLQRQIEKTVAQMTGLWVKKVNVVVKGLSFPKLKE